MQCLFLSTSTKSRNEDTGNVLEIYRNSGMAVRNRVVTDGGGGVFFFA